MKEYLCIVSPSLHAAAFPESYETKEETDHNAERLAQECDCRRNPAAEGHAMDWELYRGEKEFEWPKEEVKA